MDGRMEGWMDDGTVVGMENIVENIGTEDHYSSSKLKLNPEIFPRFPFLCFRFFCFCCSPCFPSSLDFSFFGADGLDSFLR